MPYSFIRECVHKHPPYVEISPQLNKRFDEPFSNVWETKKFWRLSLYRWKWCSNTTLIAGESNAEWDVRRNFLPLLLRFREKHVKALSRVDLPAISLFLNEQAILLRNNEIGSWDNHREATNRLDWF